MTITPLIPDVNQVPSVGDIIIDSLGQMTNSHYGHEHFYIMSITAGINPHGKEDFLLSTNVYFISLGKTFRRLLHTNKQIWLSTL